MINLLVDEAYAFDYLSILEIKKNISLANDRSWSICYSYLQSQFDTEKWQSMINSDEYKKMIEANTLTFEAVDKAKKNQVAARDVDFCNYKRYVAKQKFQIKFFKIDVSEIKIGYGEYSK